MDVEIVAGDVQTTAGVEVADDIEGHGMEVSRKSVFTANSRTLRMGLKERWMKYGITAVLRTKSLGAAMAAGCRRNTRLLKQRLENFKARIPRFQRLRRMKADPASIIRTGGKAVSYMARR